MIGVRSGPSISKLTFFSYDSFWAFSISSYSCLWMTYGFLSLHSYLSTVNSGWMRLQLLAMFSAVSILSPVSIHTLMSELIGNYLLWWDLGWFRGPRLEGGPTLQWLRWGKDRFTVRWWVAPCLSLCSTVGERLIFCGSQRTPLLKCTSWLSAKF